MLKLRPDLSVAVLRANGNRVMPLADKCYRLWTLARHLDHNGTGRIAPETLQAAIKRLKWTGLSRRSFRRIVKAGDGIFWHDVGHCLRLNGTGQLALDTSNQYDAGKGITNLLVASKRRIKMQKAMKLPVDECPAGAALDAAVAEALGWISGIHPYDETVKEWRLPPGRQGDFHIIAKDWRPSTDITQAWEIVNAAIDGGWEIDIEYAPQFAYLPEKSVDEPEWYWAVSFARWADGDNIYATAEADTASLAICRAFLKAHGVVEIG